MEEIKRETSKQEIANWLIMNVYIIVIPPFAKIIVTIIIGYSVDIQSVFTDYTLVVFAIIFNVMSLIYEKTQELLLDKDEFGVYNKWLQLYAVGCGSLYLFSATYKVEASIIFCFFVTIAFAYCVKIAKNVLSIIKRYSRERVAITQETEGQSIEDKEVKEPPEKC